MWNKITNKNKITLIIRGFKKSILYFYNMILKKIIYEVNVYKFNLKIILIKKIANNQ